jgi:hypothetical protein
MDQVLRLGIIAGLCAIALLGPVIFFDYVTPASTWAHSNPILFELALAVYMLFGVAFMFFIYGLSAVGRKQADGRVEWLAYLLIVAYAITNILALFVIQSGTVELGRLVDAPLIWLRAVSSFLLGLAIFFSPTMGGRTKGWLGLFAMVAGISILFELAGVNFDDFADAPFLIAGITLFFDVRASDR